MRRSSLPSDLARRRQDAEALVNDHVGDVVRKVKLCGLARDGKKLHADCPEVDALIDTGATVTIISRAIAQLVGAEVVPGIIRRWKGRPCAGAMITVQLIESGCGPSTHLVAVDDRLAATAAPYAFMILGQDYLKRNRTQTGYQGQKDSVRCPPRARRSKR
jgi:hypothetical protein